MGCALPHREHGRLPAERFEVRADESFGLGRYLSDEPGPCGIVEGDLLLGEEVDDLPPPERAPEPLITICLDHCAAAPEVFDTRMAAGVDREHQVLDRILREPLGHIHDILDRRTLDRHVAGMDPEDLLTVVPPGLAYVDEPVKPPGPEQRRIDHIRPVRRSHHHHAPEFLKPVDLGEDLV